MSASCCNNRGKGCASPHCRLDRGRRAQGDLTRVRSREERPLLRHVRQHALIESIELDLAGPGVVHDQLAELVSTLFVAFSIAEWFARLKRRPSRVVSIISRSNGPNTCGCL